VAGAVLAISSAANAGIIIPAGDWTLDVSGNVNMFQSWSKASGSAVIDGGLSTQPGSKTSSGMSNGLLPNFLSFTGTTRQNDLDVSFTISLQPGSANNTSLTGVGSAGNGGLNNRQAFVTFGDKSWGSVKIGKDLGIFASDAILNDMTLLGVGAGGGASGGNTTLGRIGYGYLYADWKPQIAYTTPNFSGFQATVGITQAFSQTNNQGGFSNVDIDTYHTTTVNFVTSSSNVGATNSNLAYEGKASYSFAANDVAGKIWVSGLAQHQSNFANSGTYSVTRTSNFGGTRTILTDTYNVGGNNDPMAYVGDIGAHADVAGFGLTGYYYYGSGVGIGGQMSNGYGFNQSSFANGGAALSARDSYGGYVQATYVLPTKTKLGLSWGESNLDRADGEDAIVAINSGLVKKNEMWTAGIYHPLTKHLNLVAEYSYQRSTNQADQENHADVGSLGAILFF
jgi:predicted porin